MLRILVVIFLLGAVFEGKAFTQNPDTTLNMVEMGKVQKWMADARHKMFERDWRGALTLYREVLVIDKTNAKAEYRIAECQFELYAYSFALKHLETAEKLEGAEVNKEFLYLRGKIHQRLGKLDEAIADFEAFKATLKESENKIEEYHLNKWIDDCHFAQKAMAAPLDLEVAPVLGDINSRYREYGAIPSDDGTELYFSSRRQNTTGGNVAGDKVFYSDIYVAKWDAATNSWLDPEHAEGKVNRDEFDDATHIHTDEDGNQIMYLTLNVNGYTKSSDIAYSKKSKKGTWGKPKLLAKKSKGGINTTFVESSATLTGDGNTMYFVAEGLKGLGQLDIYKSTKDGSGWSEPVNMGPILNTKDDENTVWVTPDGNTLYFSSNGRLGVGGYDIYVSNFSNGQWSEPKNLGYPINSLDNDTHLRITKDGSRAFFTSVRVDGKGFHDIYQVNLGGKDLSK